MNVTGKSTSLSKQVKHKAGFGSPPRPATLRPGVGIIDDRRRQQTPNTIDVLGLTDEKLGYQRFASELQGRREWCRENCHDDWIVEPIRDLQMRLIGRRFRFASVTDAVHFKLRFGDYVR